MYGIGVGGLPMSRLSLGLALACCAGQVLAQGAVAAQPGATLTEVVFSGSRVEQDISEVPVTITSVTAKDVARRTPTDLEELLDGEVGVSARALPNRSSGVFRAMGRTGNEGVNIRSLEGNRVRLQMDGVNQPSTYASGPHAAGRGDMIDAEGYKRVEVLRRPLSTQYGSAGLAGAVAFVTKDPGDLLTMGKDSQFTLKAAYTSPDNSLQLAPSHAFMCHGIKGMVLAGLGRGHETENMGTNAAANRSRWRKTPCSEPLTSSTSRSSPTPAAQYGDGDQAGREDRTLQAQWPDLGGRWRQGQHRLPHEGRQHRLCTGVNSPGRPQSLTLMESLPCARSV